MKLNELILKGRDRYDYIDVRNELSHYEDTKFVKKIETGIPNITLGLTQDTYSGYGLGPDKQAYRVFLLDSDKLIGFVYFETPKRFESSKQMFPHTYTPHAGIKKAYSGNKYISAVYKWFLDAGHNLITGHEQTEASNALWRSLARSYDLQFINGKGDVIKDITPEKAQQQDTRMLLLGKGHKKIEESQ